MNSPQYKDYYAILGVSRQADEKEIKAAYSKLARKYHPDVNPGDKAAEERFKEISEAYDVLGDAHKRSQYQSFGEQWKRASQSGVRYPQGAGPMPGGFDLGSGLSDLFETLFGGGGNARADRASGKGEDVEYAIEVTLEDALKGVAKETTLVLEDACSGCGGAGAPRRGRGPIDIGGICTRCHGTGRVTRTQRINVKVPAGIEEGRRLKLASQGAAGPDGVRGDLYLVVKVRDHATYERSGKDLTTSVDVPYTLAALGGELAVATLQGSRTLTVPAGVQSGQRIRVSGQGMPGQDGRNGDLYVRVKVTVPKDPSPRERELLRQLAALRGDVVRD